MKLFLRFFTPVLLAGAILLTGTSCMENSTVVRVRKDGSGEIFARYYFSPQMTGMLGMMNGLAADPNAAKAAPKAPSADSILKPTKESLEKTAAAYGEGVTFVRQESGKNTSGWDGYLAVYQFTDINKLKFDPSNPPGPMNDLAQMNPEAAEELKKKAKPDSGVKFAMADGLLTVNTGFSGNTISELGEGIGGGGPLGGPDGAQIDPAAAMQMAAQMFQGMRLAYFIRVDGEIAETNASHVDGTLITMSDVQVGKMMTDPKFLELVKEGEKFQNQKPTEADVEALKNKMKTIEGMKFETQDKVTIRIK